MTFIILLPWPARSATVTAWSLRRHNGIRGCDEVLRWALMPRLGGITARRPAPEIAARMRAGGLSPHGWGNGFYACGWHKHGYEKMLYCVRGQIVFRAAGGGIELGPGDNMVLLRSTAPGRFLPAWTARDHDVR